MCLNSLIPDFVATECYIKTKQIITHKTFLQYHNSKMVALIERGSQQNNGSHACYINYGYETINKLEL